MGYRWHQGRFISDQEFEKEQAEATKASKKLFGFITVWFLTVVVVSEVGELMGLNILDSKAFNYVLIFALIPAYIFRSFGWWLFIIAFILAAIYVS